MNEFENAHAFVDGFFSALAVNAPWSASLKTSHDVVDSCLRLGEAIGQEKSSEKAAHITLASIALVASVINHINMSRDIRTG